MKQIENFIRELGFSEYETRTYLTLNIHGVCTAEEISKLANIPLPRVYDTISQLQGKGFVLVTKTRPQKCKANDMNSAISSYLERKRKDVNKDIDEFLERSQNLDLSVLKQISKPSVEEDWRIWTIRGKNNAVKMRHEFENKAKKEILMFSGDASFIREDYHVLEKLIKNGVKIKHLLKEPKNKESEENIKKLKSMGVEVKTGYSGSLRGQIIDGKNVLTVMKYGKDEETGIPGSEKQFSYEVLILNNPVFVSVFKEYFDMSWKNI
ncbi:MAG: helix-turn-helix domain-containing protein [Nanoarchaeota archaeon]